MSDDNTLDAALLSDIQAELVERATASTARKETRRADSPLKRATAGQLVSALRARQKVIYGVDDRKDFFEFPNDGVVNLSRSVAALFFASDIRDNGDGTSSLNTENFGARNNLCSSEKFREQPVGAFCSGFLVAPDVIATAGHCIDEGNTTSVRFVFGFRMAAPSDAVTRIPNGDIYAGHTLIGRVEQSDGPDWALVRLDRVVTDGAVLLIRQAGRIADGAPVSVIGHPSGLPVKFAGGAAVRDNTPTTFFVANLDTYGGNSGSPVFGADNVVEGILVRGEVDFVSNGNCNVSNVCPKTGCRGEDCTRVTEFVHLIPVPSA